MWKSCFLKFKSFIFEFTYLWIYSWYLWLEFLTVFICLRALSLLAIELCLALLLLLFRVSILLEAYILWGMVSWFYVCCGVFLANFYFLRHVVFCNFKGSKFKLYFKLDWLVLSSFFSDFTLFILSCFWCLWTSFF